MVVFIFFFFKQKTAYDVRISDWSADVCSSDLEGWDLVLRFYAMMYCLPILMANRYGYEGEDFFWGGSRILDPHGRELAAASEGQEIGRASCRERGCQYV